MGGPTAGGLEPAQVLRLLSRSADFLPHFAVVNAGSSSATSMSAVELRGSTRSWFPLPGPRETVEAKLVARVIGHIGVDAGLEPATDRSSSRLIPGFRGWSAVVLTGSRLAGICPRGDAVPGPIDFERGTAVAWSFPLDHVEAAGVVQANGRPVVAVRSTDRLVGGIMLEAAHRLSGGSIHLVRPDDLAVALNTATARRQDPSGRSKVPSRPAASSQEKSADTTVATPDGPAPPDWLMEPPPAGFWPPQAEPVAAPRELDVIDVRESSPGALHSSDALGFQFDATSWFPSVQGSERAGGAFLVSMVMFEEGPEATAFRGTSTLVVTPSRLIGICARGDSAAGRLEPSAGRVAAWHIRLDAIDWARAEGSDEGGHVTVKGPDGEQLWALLAKPRVVVDGTFRPALPSDLAELVNRAKRSSQ